MNDKMNNLRAKLFLDDHHRMERFCLLFLLLAAVVIGCYVNGWQVHRENEKLKLTAKAIYTVETKWSLTGETVRVVDLYRNDNSTKIFMLLKISNANELPMINLSTDANDYQIMMTGAQGSKIVGNPKADIYMFADTGYMGLYFTESSGFSSALYDVVLRNTKMLKQDVNADENSKDSFKRFNQIRLYANFAGTDATIADFLNKENPTVEEIYSELLLKKQAEGQIAGLNQTLIEMNNEMARINDVSTSLSSYGINVPSLPAAINGDYITLEEEPTLTNPNAFDYAMMNTIESIISTRYNITIDTTIEENAAKYKNSDTLYLVTDYVFPGGYQFNHQDLAITDGVLDTLMADCPENMTFKEFAETKALEEAEYNVYTKLTFDDWYYNTGNKFIYDSYNASPDDTAIYNAINRYEASVTNLYNLKKKYQTEQLADLLRLESKSKDVANIFSIRSDKDTLIMY